MKIPVDKQLHFLGSYALAASIYILSGNIWIAVSCAALVGIVKEVYDSFNPRNYFSIGDITANIAGIAALLALVLLFASGCAGQRKRAEQKQKQNAVNYIFEHPQIVNDLVLPREGNKLLIRRDTVTKDSAIHVHHYHLRVDTIPDNAAIARVSNARYAAELSASENRTGWELAKKDAKAAKRESLYLKIALLSVIGYMAYAKIKKVPNNIFTTVLNKFWKR